MADQPRVLIIEDNDVLRMMLFTVLRQQPLAVDNNCPPADSDTLTRMWRTSAVPN